MAFFVSFEGGEGSGKSTQARLLEERLRRAGISVLPIHEPGSTPLGRYVRDWLKRGPVAEDTISHSAELFMFAAARAELVTKLIQPAVERGDTVIVVDRFADSTIAYQGYGRGIPLKHVVAVNELATQGVMPDLTFLLDCTPEDGLRRVGAFQLRLPLARPQTPSPTQRDEEGTRFEEESLEFHQRVRLGYLELAEQEPNRWRVIDAGKSIEELSGIIWSDVLARLPSHLKTSASHKTDLDLDSAARDDS